MKKFRHYALLTFAAMAVFGCSKDYDDTELRNDVSDLKSRVEKLETWCTTVNSQISALQGLVTALEAKDYVTGVSPVTNGYTITFNKSDAITIYNGKDGAKGTDGVTPVIGVAKDTDGQYYWTVKTGTAAATWMLDAEGKKIRTTGDKGDNGSAGTNGTTPVLSVATDTDGKVYWKVNGTWLLNNGQKVQATGDKGATGATGSTGAAGADGADGDAVFAADGVTVDKTKGTVTFTLAGEDGETFTLPMASEIKIFDSFTEFKVNVEKHELTLALNVKDGDYAALKAELTSSKGMETAMVKASTRAAATPWGVTLTAPTFKADKTIDVNAKVGFTLPSGIAEGEFALLKVTVVGKDGKEHASTRVIVYTTEVSVESVALADKSVAEGSTVKLVPTFTPATATNQNVTWISSKPEIATIANDGTVTGVTQGETVITVTTEDGGFTATCKVTVTEAPKGYVWYLAGKESGNYEISTLEELKQFGLLVNGDRTALTFNGESAAVTFSGQTVTLKNDINLNNEEWTPIGTYDKPFQGTFDGNGKVISGLKVSNVNIQYIGFFGYIKDAIMKNTEISDGTVTGSTLAAGSYAGGVVGCSNNSVIENCSNSATISGQVAGGVVGWAFKSNIKACHATGNVTAVQSENTLAAGGVVGFLSISGSIQACYYTSGTVTGGNQTGSSYENATGGVVGFSQTGIKVYNCYSTGTVVTGTGNNVYVGGVIGYTRYGSDNGSLLYITGKGASRGIGEKATDDASKVKSIASESELSANINFLNTGLPGEVGYQFKADGTLEKVQ